MELGFTQPFLIEAARRAGWTTACHPFPGCGRASAYVLEPAGADGASLLRGPIVPQAASVAAVTALIEQQQRELEAMRQSTSWRLTAPLRAVGRFRQTLTRRARPAP